MSALWRTALLPDERLLVARYDYQLRMARAMLSSVSKTRLQLIHRVSRRARYRARTGAKGWKR